MSRSALARSLVLTKHAAQYLSRLNDPPVRDNRSVLTLESEEWQTVSYVVDTQVAAAVAPATIAALGQPQSSYNISSLLLLSFYCQKKKNFYLYFDGDTKTVRVRRVFGYCIANNQCQINHRTRERSRWRECDIIMRAKYIWKWKKKKNLEGIQYVVVAVTRAVIIASPAYRIKAARKSWHEDLDRAHARPAHWH